MNKLLLLTCSFFLFTSSLLISKPVNLFLDYAVFALDDTTSLFELYYSFIDTSLVYTKNSQSNTFVGNAIINVQIKNKVHSVPEINYDWSIQQMQYKPTIDTLGTYIGQKNFQLGFGEYTVTVTSYDPLDSATKKVYNFDVFIQRFSANQPKLSDIELATDIIQIAEKSQENSSEFYKNGSLVIPNPSHEIASSSPMLKFYTEVYNTKSIESGKYFLNYKIENSLNKEVVSIPIEKESTNEPIFLNDVIPLEILPSGIYYFYVQLIYSRNDTTLMTEKRKKFYIINPNNLPNEVEEFLTEEEQFLRSEFSSLSESETDIEVEKLKILLPKNQLDVVKSLSETKAKQKFLYQYWSRLDPDPLTSINEKYEEFKENVRYSNKFYKNPIIKDGWRSDRGRVRLKYGVPTQIDLRIASSDARPHEIWFYQTLEGQANVIFVFVEVGGVNRYVQVHSTHFNELREDNWFERYARLNK
ncbi:MAG: GWxTD domain-containing protein [Candidatus Kapabacteria bacterium]|nr:GWxTD domain-containing protein [Candidatus Kapabacteria bacterium]